VVAALSSTASTALDQGMPCSPQCRPRELAGAAIFRQMTVLQATIQP